MERLRAADHEVIHLTEGDRLLEHLCDWLPDAIILGMGLDGHNSYDLCQAIASDAQLKHIPILLFSEEAIDYRNAFASGATDYVHHADSIEAAAELQARLEHHLAQQRISTVVHKHHTQRLLNVQRSIPLLTDLQRRLHDQAQKLHEKNQLLEQEVEERLQVEAALRNEQEKSEQLLLNVLPEAIATLLKQSSGVIAQRFDSATIMFADIVDFTPLAAKMPPLELVQLLNDIFSSFDKLADRYGLEKIKTIGDAYMVVGGLPIPRPDHATAVIEMAIAMQREIRAFKRMTRYPLKLRIGINTGPVIAGVIGLKKFSYDLWGDAVNVASRMESQGLPGKIQITPSTYEALKDQYQFEQWGSVHIKGKGKMTTYLYAGQYNETSSE
jgi:class 3 adenylate cyclase/CheY-like chemotaxis protein